MVYPLGDIFSNGILGQIHHLFLSNLLRLSSVSVPKPIMTEAGPISDPYSDQPVRVAGVGGGISSCCPGPDCAGGQHSLHTNSIHFHLWDYGQIT